jgi:hypothetical protein
MISKKLFCRKNSFCLSAKLNFSVCFLIVFAWCSHESQPENNSEGGEDDGINFMQFVKVLARFRRATNGKPQPLNSNNHKLECKSF